MNSCTVLYSLFLGTASPSLILKNICHGTFQVAVIDYNSVLLYSNCCTILKMSLYLCICRPKPKRIYDSDSDDSNSASEASPVQRRKLAATQLSSLCDPPLLDDLPVQHGIADRSQPTSPSPVLDTLTESKLRKGKACVFQVKLYE